MVHALQKSGLSDHAEDERNPRLPPSKTNMNECGNCGMSHGHDCPAYRKTCFTCGRNHFADKCRASSRGRRNRVSTIHETADPEQEPYCIGLIAEHKPQPRMAVIKLQVSVPTSEKEVQFQIDTGSQCDILSAWIHKQVTGHTLLRNLKPCTKEIAKFLAKLTFPSAQEDFENHLTLT